MASGHEIRTPDLIVRPLPALEVASLRCFDSREAAPAAVIEAGGGPLPRPLGAVRHETLGGRLTLAWRTPTETMVLAQAPEALAPLGAAVATARGWGCLVDQTGGFRAWQVSGKRTGDLIVRVGSLASMPAVGEARTSRMAELPVLSLCVTEGEVTLVVERVYEEHLLGWIAETAADL
jgi:sarcosine oxidase gamma subunit